MAFNTLDSVGASNGNGHALEPRLIASPSLLGEAAEARSLAFVPEDAAAEVEAKYLIEDAAQIGALVDGLQSQVVQSVSAVDVVDSYWDTPDWRLLLEGWAYRWRDASGSKSLTLKSTELDDDVVHRRLEVEQQVDEFPRGSGHSLPAGPVAWRLNRLGLRRPVGAVQDPQLPSALRHPPPGRLADRDGDRPGDGHDQAPGPQGGAGPHDVRRA